MLLLNRRTPTPVPRSPLVGTSRSPLAARRAARCTIAPFRYCLTEKEVVGGQAAGRAVARRKMTVAHTAPEPDGATRGFRARKGGRFRHEPGESFTCGRAARRRPALSALWRAVKGDPTRGLHRDPQLDPIVRRVSQILLGAEVPLGSLDRRVAQQQLDLLKLASGGATQFRRRATAIVRRDARDADCGGIRPEHLPDDLLGQGLSLGLVGAVDGPKHAAVHHAGGTGPGIDCHLDPGRYRHGPHAPVLAKEVDYAPTAIALLYVSHRQRGGRWCIIRS